eukprot:CAMPEP_0171764486 /NCGR_PEP_ID=MMETSP0991-20121206/50017_1 /TAXON_ID=483369 /ORGANISM="non described non described, Strain CCMP2098" /LENGTH=47 /DNA_ID= /DNA_START= /DNA_END= /DNA_ORIENTATION=
MRLGGEGDDVVTSAHPRVVVPAVHAAVAHGQGRSVPVRKARRRRLQH